MSCLDTIVFVKEITVRPESVQMADFISPQATFPCDDDHGVIARGGKLLLIVTDVLQTDKVVKPEELFSREDEAFLFLIEHMHWVVIFKHGLFKTPILGDDGLNLGSRDVGEFQNILKQAAQKAQISLHGA